MRPNRVIAIVLLIVVIACAPSRMALPTQQKDSVRVEIVPREVILHDTIIFEIPTLKERVTVREDSSLLINNFSRSEAIVLPSGDLFHSLETIAQELRQPIATSIRLRDSIVYRERLIVQQVEVKRELTTWQRLQISGFYLLLGLFAIAIILRRLL